MKYRIKIVFYARVYTPILKAVNHRLQIGLLLWNECKKHTLLYNCKLTNVLQFIFTNVNSTILFQIRLQLFNPTQTNSKIYNCIPYATTKHFLTIVTIKTYTLITLQSYTNHTIAPYLYNCTFSYLSLLSLHLYILTSYHNIT